MAEYIKREQAIQQCERHADYTAWSIKDGIESIPAADVAPIVHAALYSPEQTRKAASDFVEAIKRLAENPQNLENLQSYLEQHFTPWLERYANTPENMAAEMLSFANID